VITNTMKTVSGNFSIGLESNQAYVGLQVSYSVQKYFFFVLFVSVLDLTILVQYLQKLLVD